MQCNKPSVANRIQPIFDDLAVGAARPKIFLEAPFPGAPNDRPARRSGSHVIERWFLIFRNFA
jgi:hypothetical protein